MQIRLSLFTAITALVIVLVTQSSDSSIVSAQDQPDSILGKVTNATEGGELPADLEVSLKLIDLATGQIIDLESTAVDKDGIFGFSNLSIKHGPGLLYRVVVNHGIYTPFVDMSTVENWQNVRMTIYDETKSLEDITIGSYVMMIPNINARSREISVLTVIYVDNRGDRVWFPDLTDPNLTGLDLLRFNLPEGFTDLAVESQSSPGFPTGNILTIDTGFALTNSVPPGEFAVLVRYILEYEGDSFDFNLKLPYGADKVRMLLPENGGSIDAEGFGSPDSVVAADSVFTQYQGDDYAAGVELGATFSGLPQPTIFQAISDFFSGRTYVIIIIWIVGIAFLAILGYAVYSTRKGSNLSSEDDDEFMSRDDILAEIASLDERYEVGEDDGTPVNLDKYYDRRNELKRMALEINDESDDNEGETKPADSDN